MSAVQSEHQMRERFLRTLIEATFPLQQQGPDREVALELLIDAAGKLREHLEVELAELRQESD
jgi:hypothetical protein